MQTAQSLLLKLIKATINNDDIQEIPSAVDWTALFQEAKAHDIAAFLFPQFEKLYNRGILPKDTFDEAKRHAIFTGSTLEYLIQDFSEVLEAFNKANIPVIAFKGLILRSLYPNPEFRSMGDADILVHPEDLDRATEVLTSFGYSLQRTHEIHLNFTHEYRLHVEVHWTLINDVYVKSTQYLEERAWKDAIPFKIMNAPLYTLKEEEHLLYLLLHMAVHLIYSGFGLRQVIDFAIFSRHIEKNADWNNIKSMIESNSMERFTKAVSIICSKYFGVDVPDCFGNSTKKENQFAESLLEDIFSSGTFGYRTKTHQNSAGLIRDEKHERHSNPMVGFLYFLKLAFPGPSKLPQRYVYAAKCPLLLPVAWIHRIFRSLFRRDMSLKDKIELPMAFKNRAKLVDWLNIR